MVKDLFRFIRAMGNEWRILSVEMTKKILFRKDPSGCSVEEIGGEDKSKYGEIS